MTKAELQRQLDSIGISRAVYSLDGGVHDDKYVLSQEAMGAWSVYYSERGLVISKKVFDSENEACEYLMRKISADPTVRQRKHTN